MQLKAIELSEKADEDILWAAENFVAFLLRTTRPSELTLYDIYMAEVTERAAYLTSRLALTLPSEHEI